MITTSDQLGTHLDRYGVNVVLIPGDAGDDYLAATVQGRTLEVWYEGGEFSRAFVAGPAGGRTFTDLTPLLKELGVDSVDGDLPVPVDSTPEGISYSPDPLAAPAIRWDGTGRILGDPVVVGDMWACHSVRERGLTFIIVRVSDTHAYGEVWTDSLEVRRQLRLNADAYRTDAYRESGVLPYPYARSSVGDMNQVRLDRMRPTLDGYYRLAPR